MQRWFERLQNKPMRGTEVGLFSTEALRRAWQIVRRNGTTPGVDRVTQRDFERQLDQNLEILRTELESGTYEPLPVRRVWIPKATEGHRPLAIWAIRDRIAQRVVHDYLVGVLEPRFLNCSYGFRPGHSVDDAVQAVLEARDAGRRWVVDADIKDCFESLDARRLMGQVRSSVPNPVVSTLVGKWLRAEVSNTSGRRPARAGASQGGVITPVLANLYLHPFDRGVQRQAGFGTLVRFADDFVILCQKQDEARRALQTARRLLSQLRLTLNPYKTRIVHFDQGFRFLGVFFLRDEHFSLT